MESLWPAQRILVQTLLTSVTPTRRDLSVTTIDFNGIQGCLPLVVGLAFFKVDTKPLHVQTPF